LAINDRSENISGFDFFLNGKKMEMKITMEQAKQNTTKKKEMEKKKETEKQGTTFSYMGGKDGAGSPGPETFGYKEPDRPSYHIYGLPFP
jgi:hypothetical protein